MFSEIGKYQMYCIGKSYVDYIGSTTTDFIRSIHRIRYLMVFAIHIVLADNLKPLV